jgi:N-acetyltransferase
VITPRPTVLEGHGVRLEPLAREHHDGLVAAAGDGELWTLWFTSVPAPGETQAYVAAALAGQDAGHMLPWAVRELDTGAIVGSTRYHDIVTTVDRVEIGYTWYARRSQKSHVNTACKLLLLGHAFDELGCAVVGFRTDNFNFASQSAIAALGAKQDGVIRHHQSRRDGTVRDTVMFSILATEWRDVKRHLELRLARHRC